MWNREEDFIEIIRTKLKPDRFEHSINVAKSAVRLAKKYGADEEKAYVCGILHDVMKNTDKNEQLRIIMDSGMKINELEKSNPKLWHAMAGSAYMKVTLGINDEDMLNAVRYHTTARENMSILEKIIYIADFISDDRDYEGVEIMRQKAIRNINDAILEGTKFSIIELAKSEKEIHTDTFGAYNEMCRLVLSATDCM